MLARPRRSPATRRSVEQRRRELQIEGVPPVAPTFLDQVAPRQIGEGLADHAAVAERHDMDAKLRRIGVERPSADVADQHPVDKSLDRSTAHHSLRHPARPPPEGAEFALNRRGTGREVVGQEKASCVGHAPSLYTIFSLAGAGGVASRAGPGDGALQQAQNAALQSIPAVG